MNSVPEVKRQDSSGHELAMDGQEGSSGMMASVPCSVAVW